jgi:iron(III) transport system ATP-binding protein
MYLTLDHLTKKFPPRGKQGEVAAAVNDISLNIEKGQFVTLLGPSGCGKTTTLRLVAGFEFPTIGHITLDGAHLEDVPPNNRNMAMVFQSYAIFPHLNVFENIAYGLKIKKLSNAEIKRRIDEVVSLVQLGGLEDRAPNQLSGGQQQRVALARALVVEPKVLLFDEPLSNLDAKLRAQMRFEIRRLQQHLGITSVYVTHDQAEAMALSDRIVVMNQGRIEQVGTPEEVYKRPTSKFVADFIGRANFVDAKVNEIKNSHAVVTLFGKNITLPCSPKVQAGTQAHAMVRPESIKLSTTVDVISGDVKTAAYLGSLVEYEVEVNGVVLLVVDYEPKRVFAAGDRVGVSAEPSHTYLLPLEK